MNTLESIVLSYLANALWQVPVLFAAAWFTARAVRRFGPSAEHRVWVASLLLQVLLPAASAIPWEDLRDWFDLSGGSSNSQPHVSVVMGPGTTFGNPHLPGGLLTAVAIVYLATTAWFAARFVWRVYKVHLLALGAGAATVSTEIAAYWSQCEGTFGVEGASLGTLPHIYGPITIGMRRRLVLLPPGMLAVLPDAELRTAIAHEFAHMRRHDFLKNLLYELLSLPVRFHPVLSLTRERLMETREMICDQLAAGLGDQHQYARSLLRLASLLVEGMPAVSPHTIGIFDATTFERRVMRLTEKRAHVSKLRRLATVSACALLGIGICATAMMLSVHVDALAQSDQKVQSKDIPNSVDAKEMEKQIVHKVTPVYPPDAKKARIEGKVELDAVIGKDGEVEQLKVVSGPKELQQSALDAVRQWTYKPYLFNGEPIEVRTTINIIYTLAKTKEANPEKK